MLLLHNNEMVHTIRRNLSSAATVSDRITNARKNTHTPLRSNLRPTTEKRLVCQTLFCTDITPPIDASAPARLRLAATRHIARHSLGSRLLLAQVWRRHTKDCQRVRVHYVPISNPHAMMLKAMIVACPRES